MTHEQVADTIQGVRAMKLYEIHQAVQALEDQMMTDPEIGEILCDMDAIDAQLHSLQLEWEQVLEHLAKLVLNSRAEAVAIKAEEDRLKKRREALEKKEDRLMLALRRECPTTTKLGVATMKKTTSAKEAEQQWLKSGKN